MDKKTEALKLAQNWYDSGNENPDDFADMIKKVIALAEQPAQQEPVAKPYAYEYGRNNGDGTYSVVIEKGDLVQTAPAVYNYVRPRKAHKDWPIKELFDSPPASKPLTDDEIAELMKQTWGCASIAPRHAPAFARAIEAAHGIKGDA